MNPEKHEDLEEVGTSLHGAVGRTRQADTNLEALVYRSAQPVVVPAGPGPARTVLDTRGQPRRLASLLAEVSRILAPAHARGEAHGRLRPEGILLLPWRDGGEAACVVPPGPLPAPEQPGGVSPCTAPEQI